MTSEHPFEYAYALADFSLSLYRQIAAENNESNIFVSPLSISFALAMTYAGANGDTKSQMKKILFGDWSPVADEGVHYAYVDAIEKLNERGNDFKLHLANRIYAHQDKIGELLPEFTNLLKEVYGSELQSADFGDENVEKTRKLINDWVAEKTDRKIVDLIPSGALSDSTRLVLVNAIYFKGDWKKKFYREHTYKKRFFSSVDVTKQLDTMNKYNRCDFYLEKPEYQLLGIPYVGENLAMFILLPKKRFGLQAIEDQLTGQNLLEALEKVEETTIDQVSIPKFKLEKTTMVAEMLKKLGATDMFSKEKADFSKINGKRNLYVSDVLHKAFIEVNESGTEAAAASLWSLAIWAGPPQITFIADHPFLFLIVDARTTSILFLGRFTG